MAAKRPAKKPLKKAKKLESKKSLRAFPPDPC